MGKKTFLENVYDDVVKTCCKHFASYIEMFDECFVNIALLQLISPSLINYARSIVFDSYHYD